MEEEGDDAVARAARAMGARLMITWRSSIGANNGKAVIPCVTAKGLRVIHPLLQICTSLEEVISFSDIAGLIVTYDE